MEVFTIAAAKCSKKGESKLRQGEDKICEELAPGVEIVATQGDEGGPSKKARATRKKKVLDGEKTASQLHEKLNLEPITVETNLEQNVVNQGVAEQEQPNKLLVASDEISSEGSESESDRKGPRQRETPVAKLKDEVKEMRVVMTNLMDQNQMLIEILKSRRSSSSDATKSMYMKNVPKPTTWDTIDKKYIEVFLTEYETYCDASGYNSDDVKVRSFGSFLRDGTSIAFAAWRGSRGEDLSWDALKEWAVEAGQKPHQHLLDVMTLDAMKWRNNQNLSRYVEEYKAKYLQYDCEKNPQLDMMEAFLASLYESIRRKVWEKENLPTTMMELLDVVIRLSDAREVGCPNMPNGKRLFEKTFGGEKHKFPK